MKEIKKAIVMSDIHLGDEESYLYSQNSDYESNKKILSKLLKKNGPIDELILNGDILELILGGLDAAYFELREFFALLAELDPLERVVYIPGNHDHHFWRALGERLHIEEKIKNGKRPPSQDEYCNLFVDQRYSSRDPAYAPHIIFSYLWPHTTPAPEFIVKYPHHQVRVAHGNRGAKNYFITHGHFLEDLFRPVNYLIEPNRLAELEAFNNLWLEAFNYHLGHAGRLSENVVEIEKELKIGGKEAKRKIKSILDAAYRNFKEKTALKFPYSCLIKIALGILLHNGIPQEVEKGVSKLRGGQLDQKLLVSIKNYIEKYIVHRYKKENREKFNFPGNEDLPTPFTFIFGHTHMPFGEEELKMAQVEINGKHYGVRNTGGWLRSDGDGNGDGQCAGIMVIDKNGANWNSLNGQLK